MIGVPPRLAARERKRSEKWCTHGELNPKGVCMQFTEVIFLPKEKA
jgi:hypothetical protein